LRSSGCFIKKLRFWHGKKQILNDVEKVSEISHSISLVYDICRDFEKIEESPINGIIKKISSSLWLYAHSALRFGAEFKVTSLNLLSSAIEGLQNACAEVIEFLRILRKMWRKIKSLVNVFFADEFSRVKKYEK